MTALCQLVASQEDSFGYITYVFKCLEDDIAYDTRYIMCVRYPNWMHRPVTLGEIGYLSFKEVRAGIDKWFDGENMIPYKYDDIQFIKFIEKPEEISCEYIM